MHWFQIWRNKDLIIKLDSPGPFQHARQNKQNYFGTFRQITFIFGSYSYVNVSTVGGQKGNAPPNTHARPNHTHTHARKQLGFGSTVSIQSVFNQQRAIYKLKNPLNLILLHRQRSVQTVKPQIKKEIFLSQRSKFKHYISHKLLTCIILLLICLQLYKNQKTKIKC